MFIKKRKEKEGWIEKQDGIGPPKTPYAPSSILEVL